MELEETVELISPSAQASLNESITHNSTLPIRTLPAEILGEIFTFYVSDIGRQLFHTPNIPRMTAESMEDPTVLTQVCSFWRHVAIQHQYLWSRIYDNSPHKSHVAITRLWLQRAGTHPLTLRLTQRERRVHNDFIDVASNNDVFDLFISRIAYWKEIDFTFDHDFAAYFAASLASSPNMPSILDSASLDIQPFSFPYRHPPGSTLQLRGNAPNLHVPEADGIWKILHSSPVLHTVVWHNHLGGLAFKMRDHIPFQQLTHLTLEPFMDVDNLLSLMSKCSYLQVLTVKSLLFPSKKHAGAEHASLQHLLAFRVCGSAPLGPLFNNMSCPSLQALQIDTTPSKTHTICTADELQNFLWRSSCCLRELEIQGDPVSDDVLECVVALHDLQGLSYLGFSCHTPHIVVEQLTRQKTDGTHVLLPHLEQLCLGSCHATHDELLKLACSRWHLPSCRPGIGPSRPIGTLTKLHLVPALQDMPAGGWTFESYSRNQRVEPIDENYLYRHNYLDPASPHGEAVLRNSPGWMSDSEWEGQLTEAIKMFSSVLYPPAPT